VRSGNFVYLDTATRKIDPEHKCSPSISTAGNPGAAKHAMPVGARTPKWAIENHFDAVLHGMRPCDVDAPASGDAPRRCVVVRRLAMSSVREFRFRSPERNRETDERRIALIQKVVSSAVAEQQPKRQDFEPALRKHKGH
jgi:hypothetical protein